MRKRTLCLVITKNWVSIKQRGHFHRFLHRQDCICRCIELLGSDYSSKPLAILRSKNSIYNIEFNVASG